MEILLEFLFLIALLFLVPNILYRFLKLPRPISQILLGLLFGPFLFNIVQPNEFVQLFSSIGIITLFLLAGLDLDLPPLLKKKKVLLENLGIHGLIFIGIGIASMLVFDLGIQEALLVALALVTPSAGYIFTYMKSVDLTDREKHWIESKAITGEIAAILFLVIINQINDPKQLAISIVVLGLLVWILPKVLSQIYHKLFHSIQGSMFSLVFALAFVAAEISELVGAHFLVGAFIAGAVAREFLDELLHNDEKEKQIVNGVHNFTEIFVPFYFFFIGLSMTKEGLALPAIILGVLLTITVVIVRLAAVISHRTYSKKVKESSATTTKVALLLSPTLIFTIVVADILRTQFQISSTIYGSLIVYGALTAFVPLGISWVERTEKIALGKKELNKKKSKKKKSKKKSAKK